MSIRLHAWLGALLVMSGAWAAIFGLTWSSVATVWAAAVTGMAGVALLGWAGMRSARVIRTVRTPPGLSAGDFGKKSAWVRDNEEDS